LVILAGGLAHGSFMAANNSSGSGWSGFAFVALIGLAVYLLFLRPQRARMKRTQGLQKQLEPGQTVMTTGGLFGTVAAVDDDAVLIEVAPGVTTRWARAAIARVVPPEDALGLERIESDSDAETRRDADDRPNGDEPVR
jgi:preprotein translocase subunit YajC